MEQDTEKELQQVQGNTDGSHGKRARSYSCTSLRCIERRFAEDRQKDAAYVKVRSNVTVELRELRKTLQQLVMDLEAPVEQVTIQAYLGSAVHIDTDWSLSAPIG